MSDLDDVLRELERTIAAPGFRDRAKQFESALREERTLPREERDTFWRRYQAAWDARKRHQQERAAKAELEVAKLTKCLDAMEQGLEESSFKSLSKDFEERLKVSPSLLKPQRDELWSRYQDLWNRRKARMVERSAESEQAKAEYSNELYSIDVSYDGAPILQSFSNWERVGHKVRAAREKLKAMQRAVKDDRRLLPRDRKAVFDQIQEFWHKANQSEETTFGVHRDRATDLYNDACHAVDNFHPGEAAAVFKGNQAELRSLSLSRDDRQRYREWFNDLWQRLQSRRNEAQTEWRGRQEAGLERLLQAREKCRDALDRVRANNQLNQEKLADAWSDSFRDRVSEWIRDGEERERDMERSLEEIDVKIADARDKLNR